MNRQDGLVAALEEAERALKTAKLVLADPSERQELTIAVRAALARWRLRDTHLPGLCADTEWITLLLLAEAHGRRSVIRQMDVFNATRVAHTTGLRVIDRLIEADLIERGPGGPGRESRILSLTTEGLRRVTLALGAIDAS